jgi:hypothetical protein
MEFALLGIDKKGKLSNINHTYSVKLPLLAPMRCVNASGCPVLQ